MNSSEHKGANISSPNLQKDADFLHVAFFNMPFSNVSSSLVFQAAAILVVMVCEENFGQLKLH